jgi:outer membrane cobalamin receptor
VVSGLCLAAASALAGAQDQQPTTGDNATVTYPAAYFSQFEPYSVNDMLDRIPGISAARGGGGGGGPGGPGSSGGSDRRGLGSGGDQVLINGRRLAGKENEGNSQLSRIPASQVDYIEIIRGTSGDLDVRGGGQVINIVLLEAPSSANVAFELNADRYHDGDYQPGAKVSVNGQRGVLNYFLSAEQEPRHEFRDSRENSYLAGGTLNDRIRRDEVRDSAPTTLIANFGYDFTDQDVAHLNLRTADNDYDTVLDRVIVDYGFTNPLVTPEQEAMTNREDSWEVGGDYEHVFDNGSRFKTLFIVNDRDTLYQRDRFNFDSGARTKDLFLSSFERQQERIVRSSYSLGLSDAQDLEVGVERAQTILDTSLQLGLLTSRPGSAAFGGLTPISNANGSVEEMRYEYFAVHNWQLNARMSLESTLLYETSTITQSGDVSQERDFNFVRPKLDYRFDITPTLQLRTTIEKDVAQLSFSDFTASAQTSGGTDDDQNQLEGNPNLVQEQSWRYDANLEYRLPNDAGVLNGNVFYHELEDVIERIDVSTPTTVLGANGNIGNGERYGMSVNSSLRLGFLGQPNMLVTARVDVEDSSITDPFTGQDRRLSRRGRGNTSFGIRHDIPSRNMNWGFDVRKGIDGANVFYDIDKTEAYEGDPFYFAWVEAVGWQRMTYRFEMRDGGTRCRLRTRYDNRIVDAVTYREIEDSCFTTGMVLALKVRGTF